MRSPSLHREGIQGGMRKSKRERLFRSFSIIALLALILQTSGLGMVLSVQAAALPAETVDKSAKVQDDATSPSTEDSSSSTGNLRIRKFYDDNGNGVRNTSHDTDPWLSNWHFVVRDMQGQIVAEGETNGESGLYVPNVPVGDYVVTETLLPGWEVTTGEATEKVTVSADQTTVIDFGNWRTTGGLENLFSIQTACTQGQTAGYAVASAGVGLQDDGSGVISNLQVPGSVAAAYLIWGAYEEESDPNFVFNGHAVNGAEYREGLDAVAYVANVTSYVSAGTHSYTVENSSPYTMLGASLYVVYASEDVDASMVTWLGGVDTAFWNRPYFPKGPDTEVYSYSFLPVDYDREATLTLSVGGGDHSNPNRGDALWVKSAAGAVPTNLVDQPGATELMHNLLTSHEGPEWDHPTVTVTIPANATYFAYQIESPEDDNGESFILFASSLTTPLDCATGHLTVNKQVNEDGDNIFEGGNDRANELGFRWYDITETKQREMGTTNETGVGPHQITETQLPGWDFVGWYDDKNFPDYSCENPQGTTLPIAVEVFEDEETSITLCNVRNFTTIDFDKVIVGGGPSIDQDWTFHVEGLGDFTEASAPVQVPTMTQYMVTETSGSYDNLYSLTDASGICSYANGVITLDTGYEGGTCVLENTRNTGEITGVKYYDHNANGVRDNGDEGVEGVTIQLSNGQSTLSASDGSFSFSNLPTGTYEIHEVLPDGWMNTTPLSVEVEVVQGEPAYVEFGNTRSLTIAGTKWNDLNGDGVRQVGEPGIQGWTINLWDDGEDGPGNIIATTQTAADGSYAFTDLEPGTYWVNEALADGWMQTSEPVVIGPLHLGENTTLTGNNFGNFQLGSISGAKWHDVDGDGNWDEDEPGLSNWLINLWEDEDGQPGAIINNTLTDEDGNYEFTDLGPGTYWLSETLQDGWEQTSSPITLGPIVMTSGLSSTGNNFGNKELPPVLDIEKSVSVETFVNPGATVEYTIVVRNIGKSTAINVVVTDQLPKGFIYIDTGLGARSFPIGDLEPNESMTLTYDVIISTTTAAGFYDNVATADADNADPVADTATVEVRLGSVLGVSTEPTLQITKTVNKPEAKAGEYLTYTLKVTNVGDGIATNVRLTDLLPQGFTFADSGLTERVWTLGSMFTDDSRTITYEVKVADNAASGNYTNVAKVVADNHAEVRASQNVVVKGGQVLGLASTGSDLGDLAAFGLGLMAIVSGLVVLYDARRIRVPLNQ